MHQKDGLEIEPVVWLDEKDTTEAFSIIATFQKHSCDSADSVGGQQICTHYPRFTLFLYTIFIDASIIETLFEKRQSLDRLGLLNYELTDGACLSKTQQEQEENGH